MALFGPNEKILKATAQKEYNKAMSLKGDSRKEDAFRMRIALRLRGHMDKLFVEAAQKAEKFNDLAMICAAQGKPAPEPPKPSNFMKLVTASGEVWSYLPEEYANFVYRYGMLYQGMGVTGPKAISQVQQISDAIGIELHLQKPLVALEFLRTQLEEEGVDVEAEIAALELDYGDDLDEV
jgi:hypothetical protein